MITLVLEAATYAGSVALVNEGRLVAERSVAMRGREHEALMPAVAEVLAEGAVPLEQVERIVCGAGPGSFTSLRIAGVLTLVALGSFIFLMVRRDRRHHRPAPVNSGPKTPA